MIDSSNGPEKRLDHYFCDRQLNNQKRQVKLRTCADVYDHWRTYKRTYKKAPKDGLEFQVDYIDTGLALNDETRSKAPIALALHGAPGSYHDFALLIQHLSRQGVRVIAPNFPEYTATVKTKVLFRHSADEKAAYLRDFLKAINVTKIDLLVSHSSAIFPTLLILLNANNEAINASRQSQAQIEQLGPTKGRVVGVGVGGHDDDGGVKQTRKEKQQAAEQDARKQPDSNNKWRQSSKQQNQHTRQRILPSADDLPIISANEDNQCKQEERVTSQCDGAKTTVNGKVSGETNSYCDKSTGGEHEVDKDYEDDDDDEDAFEDAKDGTDNNNNNNDQSVNMSEHAPRISDTGKPVGEQTSNFAPPFAGAGAVGGEVTPFKRNKGAGKKSKTKNKRVVVQFEQPIEIKAVALFNPAGHRLPKSMKPTWFKCGSVHVYQHKLGRSLFRKLGPAFLTVVGVPVRVDNMDNVMLSATVMRNSKCQRVVQQLEQLSNMKIPTLLVFSENDKLIEKEIFYEMTQFMNLDPKNFDVFNNDGNIELSQSVREDWIRVMVFKAGGHYAYSNYAKTVNKAVSELLQRVV